MDEAPIAPVPVRARKIPTGIIVAVLFAIAVAISASAAWYWYAHSPLAAFRTVAYVAGTYDSRGLYAVDWKSVHPITLPVPGKVLDYDRAGDVAVALIEAEDGSQEIYRVDGAPSQITDDGTIKSSIALSPDASRIAYAVRTATTTPEAPQEFYELPAWSIEEVSITASDTAPERAHFGPGYGPNYFMHNGATYLLFARQSSIHVVNLSTRAEQDIPVDRGGWRGRYVPVISSDGMYLALPNLVGGYALYTLKETEGSFTLLPSGSFAAGTGAVAFDGDTFISAVLDDSGATLYRGHLADPAHPYSMRALPDALILTILP